MKERHPRRDERLKEFALEVQNGNNPSVELQEDFLFYTKQIAARKCLRMGMGGERLQDFIDGAVFDVFIAIRTGKYEVTNSPAAAYVSMVTRNHVILNSKKMRTAKKWLRKQKLELSGQRRRKKSGIRYEEKREVERRVIFRQTLAQVLKEIDELTEPQRDVLLLSIRGFSYKEIRRKMGLSQSALGNRLFRAREKLREVVDAPLDKPQGVPLK
jgi:RNA polymerase sigma factor (sigma-70 family)